MSRVYTSLPGPAAIPESVLSSAGAELLDYQGSGMSILEMSHRSPEFQAVIDDAEATLRRLLSIPDGYHVLFLQGGATLEFAGIPMNLMRTQHAGYLVTGNFARKAWQEAQRYGKADVLASSEDTGFDRIPPMADVNVDPALDYVYICQNNTIFGTMFNELPACGDVPLVADVSSCFLSMPLDVSRYGLIYAGAQKNAGPAGTTVIIVRDDLVSDGPALDICPSYLDYRTQAAKDSMLNTPNTWGIYLSGKVFRWVEEQGGLAVMERRNREKAGLLYDALDASDLFRPTASPESRSISNVCFRTGSDELDAAFVAGADARGLKGTKGHRLTGGMRASVYNAVPVEGVRKLVSYMHEFEQAHAGEVAGSAPRSF
ncbi:MAG: 3-phosphoserine/phosphohydroxythreonine transaminase [Atopobiaceae bacterium]|nr:3-phosphoserine/phosphohydroxythreonine transaminase [Atopobiaceae bacterium]